MATSLSRITRLIRPAGGSSQPWFCRLDDDSVWLVKFSGAGPGRGALVAEYVANGLGRHWGLPIPECRAVVLNKSVPRAGTDEFWDVLAASEGENLAVRVVEGATDVVPGLDLPVATLQLMLPYDTVLANWDRTSLSRNLMRDPAGELWWIDHGSCRFLHNVHREPVPRLPSNHFLVDMQDRIEGLPLAAPDRPDIDSLLAGVPTAWFSAIDGDRDSIAAALTGYLRRALG